MYSNSKNRYAVRTCCMPSKPSLRTDLPSVHPKIRGLACVAGSQFYGGPDLQRAGFWRANQAPHKTEACHAGYSRVDGSVDPRILGRAKRRSVFRLIKTMKPYDTEYYTEAHFHCFLRKRYCHD
jgi:hypothetical protein